MKTLMHINHHEGEGKLEGALRMAHKLGYDGIELRWKYRFNDMTTKEYRNRVEAEKQAYPDFIFVFGGMVDMLQPEDDVKATIEEYGDFLQWSARTCGTRTINLMTGTMVRRGAEYFDFERNGSNMATDSDYEVISKWLRVVGDMAAELNQELALETHNCYIHDLAGPCARLMEMTDHSAVGINFDYGNIILNPNGETLEDSMDTLMPYIKYMHVKNIARPQRDSRLWFGTHLDQGCIDNAFIVKRLHDAGYEGFLCSEHPSGGDGMYAAKRAIEYLRFLYDYFGV